MRSTLLCRNTFRSALWLACALCSALPALRSAAAEPEWISLFDGKTLDGWQVTDFGGAPEDARVENGTLVLDMGTTSMSGVTCTRTVPKLDYEICLQAMRVQGSDFFCGLTFPIRESFCSLIVGGWGGSLIGISSFEGMDASENETTATRNFENGRWYALRLRVTDDRIQAWIDDQRVVDARPGQRRISVRAEVENSKPLGFATWYTKAALKDLRLRLLTPDEITAARAE
jgi:hypothetical protein